MDSRRSWTGMWLQQTSTCSTGSFGTEMVFTVVPNGDQVARSLHHQTSQTWTVIPLERCITMGESVLSVQGQLPARRRGMSTQHLEIQSPGNGCASLKRGSGWNVHCRLKCSWTQNWLYLCSRVTCNNREPESTASNSLAPSEVLTSM